MLIDEFLPDYDEVERHSIIIRASGEQVYAAVKELDLSDSTITRWLIRVRGLSFSSKLGKLTEQGFIFLGEEPPKELLLGLVGRFWSPWGDLQRMDADDFRTFTRLGYAKLVWNFALASLENGTVQLTTETRVLCFGSASRKRFRLYWLLVKPFSGMIRKEALRSIKRNAENPKKPLQPR